MDELLNPAADTAVTPMDDGAELRGSSFDYLTQPGTDLAAVGPPRGRRCWGGPAPGPNALRRI